MRFNLKNGENTMTIKHFDQLLNKYADLITQVGINVKPGQDIIIYAEIDQADLVHRIMNAAYALGANQVIVEWKDTILQREFLKHADEATLSNLPAWFSVRAESLMATHTSRISIVSSDPDGFSDVASDRVSLYEQAYQRANSAVRQATMNNDVAWLVVAAAGKEWSQKVFPDLSATDAQDKLWQEIFNINRINLDNDVIADWQAHINKLNEKAAWLNKQNFKELRYRSAKTDLTIGLAENHVWEAAESFNKAGNRFVPNMPTEEVFTSPDYRHIDGTVQSTKPLSYSGVLITDIQLTFENGRVVAADATNGKETLQQLIKTDAGAASLGEVSLVPHDSPISNSNIVFYTTLIDENASDHLALGAAYPSNIKSGTQMSVAERQAKGQNDSLVHVDFMIGSSDMDIDGVSQDGHVIPVFRDGNWI